MDNATNTSLIAQETARGRSFALQADSPDVAGLDRLHWHDLGRRLVVPAMAAQWDSVRSCPPARYGAEDRAKRAGVAELIEAAINQLQLPAGQALDFTGLPLTGRVLDAIVRLAERTQPRGIVVIAEPEDADTLARLLR